MIIPKSNNIPDIENNIKNIKLKHFVSIIPAVYCKILELLTEYLFKMYNHIGGVLVSVLVSSAVDRGFEPRSGKTKDYAIGISCFSAKHAALRRQSKYWSARNQNNVSE